MDTLLDENTRTQVHQFRADTQPRLTFNRHKTQPGKKMKPKSAFTLIELLVVIGILSILAALLLPAIGKARERGNATKCVSNIRQWGSAMMLYLAESGGEFPSQGSNPDKADPRPGGVTNAWFHLLPPFIEENPYEELWPKNAIPRPGDKSIFICPATKPVNSIPGNNGRIYYSDYGMNLWLEAANRGCGSTGDSGFGEFLRISQIKHPSTFAMWAEQPQGRGSNGELGYLYGHTHAEFMGFPDEGHAFRHPNLTANICFADGHVDTFKRDELYNPAMDKFWNFGGVQWNPDNPNIYGACQ